MPSDEVLSSSDSRIKFRITVDNCDDWLQYEARFEVLVCRHHGYAISNLSSHLRTKHSGTSREKAAVASKYSHLQILNPTQVQLLPPLEPPIQSLGKFRDAFMCDEEECKFIT